MFDTFSKIPLVHLIFSSIHHRAPSYLSSTISCTSSHLIKTHRLTTSIPIHNNNVRSNLPRLPNPPQRHFPLPPLSRPNPLQSPPRHGPHSSGPAESLSASAPQPSTTATSSSCPTRALYSQSPKPNLVPCADGAGTTVSVGPDSV